jgi:hypothetical protein
MNKEGSGLAVSVAEREWNMKSFPFVLMTDHCNASNALATLIIRDEKQEIA